LDLAKHKIFFQEYLTGGVHFLIHIPVEVAAIRDLLNLYHMGNKMQAMSTVHCDFAFKDVGLEHNDCR
jgi:hypothetical protein